MDFPVDIHMQTSEEPTSLKAAWELMELFYADKSCLSWLPERLVDWLSVISFFPQHLSYLNLNLLEFIIYHLYHGRTTIYSFRAHIRQSSQSSRISKRNLLAYRSSHPYIHIYIYFFFVFSILSQGSMVLETFMVDVWSSLRIRLKNW